ncbi:hypothetical protein [Helicobacter anatolicus]|uniref:hypothetical protein n=1 Tax=Helicobacter anatolicus TaxID=2905874 RepID=UPI001E381321|nr:hypothetical protein [Helicobacter anatolicus]MCE3037684.1 hypothetical protein [Helicobacter anatolicus]MCE3040029.1 hypothetical protein [Helicobacter anatolicus]
MFVIKTNSTNYRDLSKKRKFFGLSFMAWFVALYGNWGVFILIQYSVLMLLVITLISIITLYIAEFFDEDFFEILIVKTIDLFPKSNRSIFYP